MDPIEKFIGNIAWLVPLVFLLALVLPAAVRILREYERGVIFRLGKLLRPKGPA